MSSVVSYSVLKGSKFQIKFGSEILYFPLHCTVKTFCIIHPSVVGYKNFPHLSTGIISVITNCCYFHTNYFQIGDVYEKTYKKFRKTLAQININLATFSKCLLASSRYDP